MDDKSPPSNITPSADRTADSLRELHERARSAMQSQRERMGALEARLTEQIDAIAATLADHTGAHSDEAGEAAKSLAEVEHLRRELDAERSAWQAERDEAATEHASRQQQLEQRLSELEEKSERLDADRAALDGRQHALDERAAQLNTLERETRQRQDKLSKREQQMSVGQQDVTEVTRQFDEERAAWDGERNALNEAKSNLEQQRDELNERITQLTEQVNKLRDESGQQMADFEQQLEQQQAAWDEARATLEKEKSAVATKRDELAEALAKSGQELATTRQKLGAAGDSAELQQKFDLALEDVQRLRQRVAELEQELAARPAADDGESVELVHLRSERDALAERVSELEQQQSAAPADADAAQEMADLQRRFELAVEDVRDLKRINAQLEEKLAAAQSGTAMPGSNSDAGGGSWEALKQQMLANLEGEADDGDVERREERAKIEDTIRITDDVVANKDREIAELKAQLAEGGERESAEDAAVREMIDADTVIQQHREKIAAIEAEMNEKLRAAELELSVERAKIAREQAQLGDLRAELESIRSQHAAASGSAGDQGSRRKWLSKLGLGGEEEDK